MGSIALTMEAAQRSESGDDRVMQPRALWALGLDGGVERVHARDLVSRIAQLSMNLFLRRRQDHRSSRRVRVRESRKPRREAYCGAPPSDLEMTGIGPEPRVPVWSGTVRGGVTPSTEKTLSPQVCSNRS